MTQTRPLAGARDLVRSARARVEAEILQAARFISSNADEIGGKLGVDLFRAQSRGRKDSTDVSRSGL